jgi:hypothetical protein
MIFFVPLKNNILILYIFQITYLRHFSVFLIILKRNHNDSKGGIKDGLVAKSWASTINGAGWNNYLVYEI